MAREETDIQNTLRLEMAAQGFTMFRNNTGLFYTLDKTRKVFAGLGKGTHDLIGIRPTVITQDMVGKIVGVFTTCEVKAGTDMSPEQANFMRVIRAKGGISFVGRSAADIPQEFIWPEK